MLYQLTDAAARSEASRDIIRYKMCLLSFTSTDWVYIKNIEQINPQDVKSALQHIYVEKKHMSNYHWCGLHKKSKTHKQD